MKHIYIFSGLGADERVFQYLKFGENKITFIKWQQPKSESIRIYASRLLHQIKAPKPILVGLSFGGMVAVEVAKHIDTERVILIASAKTKNEIPFYYRLAGYLRLHAILPISVLKRGNSFSYWLFGAIADSEKKLLKEILKDTDPVFLKWAINQIVHWKNKVYPTNVIHIHGSSDRILPIRFIKFDIKVPEGGHFMTINKAQEIETILGRILQ